MSVFDSPIKVEYNTDTHLEPLLEPDYEWVYELGTETASHGSLCMRSTLFHLFAFNSLKTRNGLNVARYSVSRMNQDQINQAVLPQSKNYQWKLPKDVIPVDYIDPKCLVLTSLSQAQQSSGTTE